MHQNFQDQLIPSYFIYWVQKPCWIKGRSEFRSNNQCFFEKKHCGMQRDRFFCITNQPILLTLEATPLIPTYPFVHLLNPNIPKKKQPVTSNSIPDTEKSSDTRWCISTCMSWKLIGPTLGRPPASATKCFGLVETFGHLTCPTGLMKVVPPNVGGSQKNPTFPSLYPKKAQHWYQKWGFANFHGNIPGLRILKKLHRHRFGRVTWHLSMGKLLLFFEAVNWQWSIHNIQKPTLFTQFSQRVAI